MGKGSFVSNAACLNVATYVLRSLSMAPTNDPNLARLEELIGELEGEDDTPNALVREHLEAARSCVLGSMPAEYHFNLELVEGVSSEIKDKDLRVRLEEFLHSQRAA